MDVEHSSSAAGRGGGVEMVLEGGGGLPLLGQSAVAAGIRAGNINVSSIKQETMELSDSSKQAQEEQALILLRLEAEKRAKATFVPVDIEEQKKRLRTLHQPVTLFGEGPAERRERLRRLIAEQDVQAALQRGTLIPSGQAGGVSTASMLAAATAAMQAGVAAGASAATVAETTEGEKLETFFTRASEELKAARQSIAAFSFAKAAVRLQKEQEVASSKEACLQEDIAAAKLLRGLRRARPRFSQIAEERPITGACFSGDGRMIASSSWAGIVKVWDADTGEHRCSFRGHRDRVVSVAWHPHATMGAGGGAGGAAGGGGGAVLGGPGALLASGSVDCSIRLWKVPEAALQAVPLSRGYHHRKSAPMQKAGEKAGSSSSSSSSSVAGAGEAAGSAVGTAKSVADLEMKQKGREGKDEEDLELEGEEARLAAALEKEKREQEEDAEEAMEEERMERARAASSTLPSSSSSSSSLPLPPSEYDILELGLKEHRRFSPGHTLRLSSIAFHPSGDYLASSSFDRTWRLWHVETGKELLLQEGHAREVYPLAFHKDGSLVASGDLSGMGRLWDLRSGKSIMFLKGHTHQMLSLDFSPDGHTLVSGSGDCTCILWDLRRQGPAYVLPAHNKLVSRVRFAPQSGEYFASASYDCTVKLWSARDWGSVRVISGHESRVTGVDISPVNDGVLLTSSFDRTFKVWTEEGM